MSTIQAIILGIVQGLTEFMPISSSGHLILVPWLFGWEEPGLAFDAALHLGTLLAVVCYFWRELLAMLLAVPVALSRPLSLLRASPAPAEDGVYPVSGGAAVDRDDDARLALLIVIGSIPGGIAGLLGESTIDRFFHSDAHPSLSIAVVAVVLMGFGVLLWIADRAGAHRRTTPNLTLTDALLIGLAQSLALLPGVSRSGSTLTAGLLRGMRRADAARFSFLLGMPITAAAGAKGLFDVLQAGFSGAEATVFAWGILASALSGFAAIWILLRYLQRSTTSVFAVYRLLVGLTMLGLLLAGVR